MNKFSLAIHGGAGTLLKSETSASKDQLYHNVLSQALSAGHAILSTGGSAILAVEASVKVLEDSELFNAGRGSVFTCDETHELEASIMCGRTLQAGAVAGVQTIKNPISICKELLSDEDFVYLMGKGAEKYAVEKGLETVSNDYFSTDFRRKQLLDARRSGSGAILDHDAEHKFGTVGAVAMDQLGNLASATSTGGLTNKKYNRVGDSSLIGSGCYASNDSCAISATGYGEFFIRNVTAHEIASIIRHGNKSLKDAAYTVVQDQLVKLGGEGGIIGVDKYGKIVLEFNSEGMYRGWLTSDNPEFHTAIYRD